MTVLASAALVVGVALFVGWPLLRSRTGAHAAGGEDRLAVLQKRKLDAYAALKEAELDFRTGKMSEEDFRAIEARCRSQALQVIEELQRLGAAEGLPPREPTGERKPRSGKVAFCPSCGTRVLPPGNFCGGCGRDLRALAA